MLRYWGKLFLWGALTGILYWMPIPAVIADAIGLGEAHTIALGWSFVVAVALWRCGLRLPRTRPVDLAGSMILGYWLAAPVGGMLAMGSWLPERYAWEAFLGAALSLLLVSLLLPVWAIWTEIGQPGRSSRPYGRGGDRRRPDHYRFVRGSGEDDWEIAGPKSTAGLPGDASARVAVVPAGLPSGRGTEASAAVADLPQHAPAYSPRRRARRPILRVAIAALVGCGLVGLAWRSEQRTHFDRRVWMANPTPDLQDNPRSRMVRDLMRHHLKLGMPRRQVQAMLGEAEYPSLAENGNQFDHYTLGHMGWFGIDPSLLRLEYDRTDRLTAMEVFET